MIREKFVRVSRKLRCPICGKHDWCGISYDGTIAICMRIQSGKTSGNGGWIHRIGDPVDRTLIREAKRKKQHRPNFKKMHKELSESTKEENLYLFAEELGVTIDSLHRMNVVRHDRKKAWAFPMYNHIGDMTGLRLRSSWGKWALDGSNAGLFTNRGEQFDSELWLVVEGATDTAAAISLEFNTVGRPSCRGQEIMLRDYLDMNGARQVIIIPDNDEPKHDSQGRIFYPGIDGAIALTKKVAFNASIVMPPCNDFRTWVNDGITKDEVVDYISKHKKDYN